MSTEETNQEQVPDQAVPDQAAKDKKLDAIEGNIRRLAQRSFAIGIIASCIEQSPLISLVSLSPETGTLLLKSSGGHTWKLSLDPAQDPADGLLASLKSALEAELLKKRSAG